MDQVSNAVFPHGALEMQKLWMVQGMKKLYDSKSRCSNYKDQRLPSCLSNRIASIQIHRPRGRGSP
jgi:hypothetical protein